MVLKPPEQTPFSGLAFARLCEDAGLPPGVVNVVAGGAEAGAALCGHPGVDKITFTGGGAAAAAVATEAAAEHHTPVVLELGGKSASIVFDDADPAGGGQARGGPGCAAEHRARLLPADAAVRAATAATTR